MNETRNEISPQELKSRVAFSLLLPVAQIATTLGLPLSDMKKWLETAYFQEARRRGLELKDVKDVMHVSISKASLLSRQLKRNFLDSEQRHELPRRIEYMLWAQPLSRARLSQVLPDVEDTELDEALAQLLDEERVEIVHSQGAELYRLKIKRARRVWDDLLARLDGLNNALRSVGDTVFSRFFDPDSPSFARTLTFHVQEQDIERLERFYEEILFPFIEELNEAAEAKTDEANAISLSLFWARRGAAETATAKSTETTKIEEDE